LNGTELLYDPLDRSIDPRETLDENLSDFGKGVIEKTELAISELVDVESFGGFIDVQRQEVLSTTTGVEQTTLLIFLAVTESSVAFWSPVDKGGLGTGDEFLARIGVQNVFTGAKVGPCGNAVMKADGLGAAIGFLGVAIEVAVTAALVTAPATGGTSVVAITAGLVAVAGTSALASGLAAIEHCI
jgi:hypothetical protein